MYFFFRLPERKRYQKERAPAVPVGLLRPSSRLNGRNSLRSNSLPFLTPARRPPLYARRSMPESHAALGRAYEKQIIFPVRISRRMAAHKRRGVKRRGDFCVKNGRLFERSEFLPFSKNFLEVAPKIQRLTFFFWYLFFLCQDKKKST